MHVLKEQSRLSAVDVDYGAAHEVTQFGQMLIEALLEQSEIPTFIEPMISANRLRWAAFGQVRIPLSRSADAPINGT
jgi:hypothetical protein